METHVSKTTTKKTKRVTTKELESQLDTLKSKLDDYLDEKYIDELGTWTKGLDDYIGGSGQMINYHSAINQELDIGTLQRLFVTEGWFYIVVTAVAHTIASLPVKLEKKTLTKETLDDGSVVDAEAWVDASGEPEQHLFKYPNDISTAFEFYCLLAIDLLSTGNTFIYIDKAIHESPVKALKFLKQNYQTQVQGIYRINPALMKPVPARNGKYLEAWWLQSAFGQYKFTTDEIIHIKMPNPIDPFLGLAPIVPIFKNVLLDRYSTEHMIRFYQQGARLGGVVKTKRKLTKDQMTRLQRSFDQDFTGKKNHHKTLILPDEMDYVTIEQNPGETTLIEFIKANREPILAAYRVPPIKVALMDGSTYANALIQEATFFNNAIKPILTIIEQAINASDDLLKPERNLRFTFDLSNVEALQEDISIKASGARAQLEAGLTVNEVRQKVWKLPAIEGGDVSPAVVRAAPPVPPPGVAGDFGEGKDAPVSTDQALVTPAAKGEEPRSVTLDKEQMKTVLDIMERVGKSQLTRDSAMSLLVHGLGVDPAIAEKFLPILEIAKAAPIDQVFQNPDAEAISDIKPTKVSFDERVSQLVSQFVNEGIPLDQATRQAINQAMIEGFVPVREDEIVEEAPVPETSTVEEQPEAQKENDAPSEWTVVEVGTAVVDEPKLECDECDEGCGCKECNEQNGEHEEKTQDSTKEIAESLEVYNGAHVHEFPKDAIETAQDSGHHTHVFILPDGTEVESDYDGMHVHSLDIADLEKEGGAHVHKVVLNGNAYMTEEGGGLHHHEFGVDESMRDGAHVHKLILQDGTEVFSSTESSQKAMKLPESFTHEKMAEIWNKSAGQDIEPIVEDATEWAKGLFKKLESVFIKKVEKKLKKKWIGYQVKAQDEDQIFGGDDDEQMPKELEKVVQEESDSLPEWKALAAERAVATVNLLLEEPPRKTLFDRAKMVPYHAKNIKYIADTTRKQLRAEIKQTSESGVTIGDLSKIVRSYFSSEKTQARIQTIARTETLNAVSLGQHLQTEAMIEELGVDRKNLRKIWITAKDERVRGNPGGLYPDAKDNHWALEGQVVPYNKRFKNGLRFPRDPDGAPEQVINCRCVSTTFVEKDQDIIEETFAEEPSEFEDIKSLPFIKDLSDELQEKVRRNPGESISDCVSRAIPTLIDEGFEHYHAVGAAYGMCRLKPKKKELADNDEKGGPGSGCRGPNCGRPPKSGSERLTESLSSAKDDSPIKDVIDIVKDAPNPTGETTQQIWQRCTADACRYSAKRKELHESLANSVLREGKKSDRPLAILTAGGSGAGKSSTMRLTLKQFPQQFARLDADEFKQRLPEYQTLVKKGNPKAAAFVHEESSDLVAKAFRDGTKVKKNLIYDSTFSNTTKAEKVIKRLKNKGYRVHLVYTDVPVETAIQRAQKRAERSGRLVPLDVIKKAHEGAVKSFSKLKNLPDTVTVFDNSGNTPRVAFQRLGDTVTVKDEDSISQMNQRGFGLKESPAIQFTKQMEKDEEMELFEALIKQFSQTDIQEDDVLDVYDEGIDPDQVIKYEDETNG